MASAKQGKQAEQLRNEILTLTADIHLARSQLKLCTSTAPSPPIHGEQITETDLKYPCPPKLRFARIFPGLRRRRLDIHQERQIRDTEENSLISDRRGSDGSDKTLVDHDSAGFLLSVLGPLVAALQELTSEAISKSSEKQLSQLLLIAADDMFLLIEFLQAECVQRADQYDQEMGSLLLDALHAKVEIEQSKLTVHLAADPPLGLGFRPVQSRNPFILHASSLTASARPPSIAKPIISSSNTAIGAGQYTSFAAIGQSSWRMNIHRLGSFQASLLFSPSPVAIRRDMV